MKMVYAEEYVWKDPCVRGYETWPVQGPRSASNCYREPVSPPLQHGFLSG